jgi:hypothetical protein
MAIEVRVQSKLPNALRIKTAERLVVLNGVNSIEVGGILVGDLKNINGDGLSATTLISQEDWDFVLSQIGNSEIIKNGIIWAAKNESEAKVATRDKAKQKHGFEPQNPNEKIEDADGNIKLSATTLL